MIEYSEHFEINRQDTLTTTINNAKRVWLLARLTVGAPPRGWTYKKQIYKLLGLSAKQTSRLLIDLGIDWDEVLRIQR